MTTDPPKKGVPRTVQQKARRYQREHGVNYMAALRIIEAEWAARDNKVVTDADEADGSAEQSVQG